MKSEWALIAVGVWGVLGCAAAAGTTDPAKETISIAAASQAPQQDKNQGDKDDGDKGNKDDGNKGDKDDGDKGNKDDGNKGDRDDGDKNDKDDGNKDGGKKPKGN